MITGGPSWIHSKKFDIEAKADGDADKEQVRAMLRALLAERFNLKVHQETRDMPVYDLVVTKGGPRFAQEKVGERGPPNTVDTQVIRVGGPVSLFVDRLSVILGRPVFDKTEISGQHMFTVAMKRDDPLPSDEYVNLPSLASAPPASIFSCLQEQLGLKLEPRKGPVDVLVIDQIKPPTQN